LSQWRAAIDAGGARRRRNGRRKWPRILEYKAQLFEFTAVNFNATLHATLNTTLNTTQIDQLGDQGFPFA
jgi:hypothetical protein